MSEENKVAPTESEKLHRFMNGSDAAMQKKYPQHIGHLIQPLNASPDGLELTYLCMTCGSWEKPFPLALSLLEVFRSGR